MLETFSGRIEKKLIFKGSKSEREAVLLVTGDRDLLLVLKGASPFDYMTFDSYIGHEVTITGDYRDGRLIVEDLSKVTIVASGIKTHPTTPSM